MEEAFWESNVRHRILENSDQVCRGLGRPLKHLRNKATGALLQSNLVFATSKAFVSLSWTESVIASTVVMTSDRKS